MTKQTQAAEPARLIDVETVASILNVSTRHIYRMAEAGLMPRPLKLGAAIRWDRQVLQSWIDSGCHEVDS
jgi:excisionase family DNA binding protein